MKAKLIFDLTDPDDLMDFKRYNKSDEMANVIFQFMLNSKKELEYQIETKKLNSYDTLDLVFERFNELVENGNININEIIR